eukprot:s1892_g1.t1
MYRRIAAGAAGQSLGEGWWDGGEKWMCIPAYFSGLEIDPNEAAIIFTLMDTDHNGRVSIDEFIDGTMKLKGSAKSVDMLLLMLLGQPKNQMAIIGVSIWRFLKMGDPQVTVVFHTKVV